MLVIVIISSIGTGDMIVVGDAIGIDSTTGCIEHDSCSVCIDCDGGVESMDYCSPQVGGLIIRGAPPPPTLATPGPSRPPHSGRRLGDASAIRGNLRVLGVRTRNPQPASYKFPLSILVATYTEEEGVKSPQHQKSCIL